MEEEEMLEQTNKEDSTEEELVEEEASDEEVVEEETTQEKTFTQEEVDDFVNKRLARERKRLDRNYKETLSKYQELAYLTQEGLNANDLDETLEKSREFYGKQGIKYVPTDTNEEEVILGQYYADEIINECETLDELEKTYDKLSRKHNLSNKEKIVLNKMSDAIADKKRIAELKKIGVNESEYSSNEFIEFEKQFTKDTPINNIYNLYKMKNTTLNEVENPGSMKSIPKKEKKGYISEQDFDRMTDEEIEKNMDLIRSSMAKW